VAVPLPWAWFDGDFRPLAEVRISPLDRGFLFGDSVYEVIPVFGGRVFLADAHLDRLDRSLAALRIRNPHARTAWHDIIAGLVSRNGGGSLAVYLQVTRGADAGRDHAFPDDGLAPTVFGMATPVPDPHPDRHGIRAITRPDDRWNLCEIKATALLANVLARQAAREAGAGEALLLRDGLLTEASASSVLVVEGGTVLRPPPAPAILPGTTSDAVLAILTALGIPRRDEPVSEARLRAADEIWIAAATRGVVPVLELDGRPVGSGQPGPVWARAAAAFEKLKDAGGR
jgi:D-alanine transaminase